MQNSKLIILISGIVGSFFLVSGLGKALDSTQFADTIVAYGFPKLRFMAPIVIASELAVGLGLLLRVYIRRLALLALLLLLLFTVLFFYGYVWRGVTDCGCFGALKSLQTPPWVSFTRNGLLLVLAGWLYLVTPDQKNKPARGKVVILGSITILSFFVLVSQYSSQVFLLPKQSVQSSAIAPFCPVNDTATYLVFIFRPTCSHCWAATPKVIDYKRSGMVNKIIAIAPTTSREEEQKYLRHFNPPFAIHTITNAQMSKITNLVPTIVIIKHDTILSVLHDATKLQDSLKVSQINKAK